jgi:hypothetical protein
MATGKACERTSGGARQFGAPSVGACHVECVSAVSQTGSAKRIERISAHCPGRVCQRAQSNPLWGTESNRKPVVAQAGQKIAVDYESQGRVTTGHITISAELAEWMSKEGWLLDTHALAIVKPDGSTVGLLNQEAYVRDSGGQAPPRGVGYDPEIMLAAVPYHGSEFLVGVKDGKPDADIVCGRDISGPIIAASATKAWSVPISTSIATPLRPRWRRQAEDWRALQQTKPNEALSKARQANNLQRMLTSGTAAGKHGAVANTDGAAIAQANWHKAEATIERWLGEGRRIDVSGLLELNAILGNGLAHNGFAAGVLRSPETVPMPCSAGGSFKHHYFHPEQVGGALADMEQWLHKALASNMSRVEVAARAMQRFVSIHPFADGNGRTARALADWVLKSGGLPPATFENEGLAIFGRVPNSSSPDHAVRVMTEAIDRTLRTYQQESST